MALPQPLPNPLPTKDLFNIKVPRLPLYNKQTWFRAPPRDEEAAVISGQAQGPYLCVRTLTLLLPRERWPAARGKDSLFCCRLAHGVTLARIQKNHATTQPLSRLRTTLVLFLPESLGARTAREPWSHELSPKSISSVFR